jgi:hypothetical protein
MISSSMSTYHAFRTCIFMACPCIGCVGFCTFPLAPMLRFSITQIECLGLLSITEESVYGTHKPFVLYFQCTLRVYIQGIYHRDCIGVSIATL